MAKIPFQDVVPPERRSIRDVPIPQSGKRKVLIGVKPEVASSPILSTQIPTPTSIPKQNSTPRLVSIPYEDHREERRYDDMEPPRSRRKHFLFGGIALVAIVGFLISMMTIFASATVVIEPKSENLPISMSVASTPAAEEGSVRYEIIKLAKSDTTTVQATGEESVKLEAKGRIVVYNDFSAEPQRLIVRTRFETPEGLIYRIPESITVPGRTVKDGVSTPGSIEVEVFADEAGEKYNIKKTDFTVPGFKTDAARYKGFYARSLTEMTGGFVGKRKMVSASDRQSALENLESETRASLEKELRSKIPDGLTLLPGAIIFESRELPQTEDSGAVVLGKEVTAFAIMLDSRALSEKIVSEYKNGYPEWTDISASVLDFTKVNVTGKPTRVATGDKIDLVVAGEAQLLADVDTTLVREKLVGRGRDEVARLMDEFAGISGVTVTLRPVWKRSFPENPLKINIKTEGPNP